MISTLIERELSTIDSPMNIAFSKVDDSAVVKYFQQILNNSKLINFNDTYYGNLDPQMVICNDRISHLDTSIDICKYFHCPLLIIDHNIKSNLITNKIENLYDIKPVVQIALSDNIYLSWNKIHDYVIPISDSTIKKWHNIIYNLSKQTFHIKGLIKNANKK